MVRIMMALSVVLATGCVSSSVEKKEDYVDVRRRDPCRIGDAPMTTGRQSGLHVGYVRRHMDMEMSRPFRANPPEVTDALLRPAVLRRLLARFEARVVVVRASA